MRKLSQRQTLRKISQRHNYQSIVQYMKDKAKEDPGLKEVFREYGLDMCEIDDVSVEFAALDVSAKTKDMAIFINEKFIDEDHDPTHYLIHELVHYCQQKTGKTEGHQNVEEYLDKPTEEEAFKTQIEFKRVEDGEEESEDYLDSLLDHHDFTGKKREDKKEEFSSTD